MPSPFQFRRGDRVSHVLKNPPGKVGKEHLILGTVLRQIYYVFWGHPDIVLRYYHVHMDGSAFTKGLCIGEKMLEPSVSTDLIDKFRPTTRDVLDDLVFLDEKGFGRLITWYELEEYLTPKGDDLPERWCNAYGDLVDLPLVVANTLNWVSYEKIGVAIANTKGINQCRI